MSCGLRTAWSLPALGWVLLQLGVGAPLAQGQDGSLSLGMLDQYCIACHNDSNPTANITLSSLDPANVGADADVWEKVLRKVRAAEMPPPGLPRPEQSVAAMFIDKLQRDLDRAAMENPDPGRPAIHRLNRNEYANAIRDLLAVEIDTSEALPADDSGYGFDNIADVLSVSPVLLERYIAAARRVSRQAVGITDVVPVQEEWKVPRRGANRLKVERVSNDLPFNSRGGMSVNYYFPVDAEYVIKLDVRQQENSDDGLYEMRLPMTAGKHTVGATFFASSAKNERTEPGRFRGGGTAGSERPKTAELDIRIDGKRYKLEEITLTGGDPQIEAVYIGGPYKVTGSGDTPSRRLIFSCQPETAEEEESCANKILTNLTHRAYRRPITNDDVSPLMRIYRIGREGTDFDAGIQRALQAMLVSPNFLFRVERAPENAPAGGSHQISDVELASRLSFFLWSSIPDEELLGLAKQGKLRDPDILRRQVRRMVADRRSAALIENFAGQWLFLRNVDTVNPDLDQFGAFDETLRAAMKQETEMLFAEVLRDDRSVVDLLRTDHTYLNQQLAEHYGVPGIRGSQFRKVHLDNPNRHGLLGQASILTVTSYANRTSVVQRGAWVLDNLLGAPPPPPPPNIPTLEGQDNDGKQLTLREKMEIHRSNAVCASCHARMDPIGFALENFDAIGRWRDDDSGVPINSSGSLPDGSAFNGPGELSRLIATKYEEDFVSTAVEKLLTYALGRGLEHYDRPVIRGIMRDTADNGYSMGDLIGKVVESTPFQMRRNSE